MMHQQVRGPLNKLQTAFPLVRPSGGVSMPCQPTPSLHRGDPVTEPYIGRPGLDAKKRSQYCCSVPLTRSADDSLVFWRTQVAGVEGDPRGPREDPREAPMEPPDSHREITQHPPNSPTLHMEYTIHYQQLCKLYNKSPVLPRRYLDASEGLRLWRTVPVLDVAPQPHLRA